jgi:hypothetical protein
MLRIILFLTAATQLFAVDEFVFRSPETRVHLIELFTSEGCSSCPPAEEWFNQLRKHSKLWQDFVPVAFHVDYWDRLGWRDSFSSSENTLRQRDYAKLWGSSVYTPCFVANGKEWLAQKSGKLNPSSEMKGVLEVKVRGEKVLINFQPKENEPQAFKAWLSFLTGEVKTQVRAGENAGRTLSHTFVSLGVHQREMKFNNIQWVSEFSLKKLANASGIAVWVTSGDLLEAEQAVGGWIVDPQSHGK